MVRLAVDFMEKGFIRMTRMARPIDSRFPWYLDTLSLEQFFGVAMRNNLNHVALLDHRFISAR